MVASAQASGCSKEAGSLVLVRASDLVMKVDSLLSSQPKSEARVEYDFANERYR